MTQVTAPNRYPWPPIIYGTCLLAAFLLRVFIPIGWIPSPLYDIFLAFGVLIAGLGIAVVVSSIKTLKKANTTILPYEKSSHLVINGPYSFTRNPIYLGFTMIIFALCLIIGSIWFFIFGLIASFLVTKVTIIPEEQHLKQNFGKRYRDYSKRVRRWI